MDFVYRNTVLSIMRSTFSFTAVTFREISSIAALMKLLLAIEQHVTTAALSPPLPARGRESSPRRFFPSAMALEWSWSYPGHSTVESGGDVLKTGMPEIVPVYFTIC